MNAKLSILALAGILIGSTFTAHGADNVITNPELHSGASPHAIDPNNRSKLWPSNKRPTKAQLYALPGFAVIQDFSGFVARNKLDGGTNIVSFSDPKRADLRVRFAGAPTANDSGRSNLGEGWWTSPKAAFLLANDNKAQSAHTITAYLDFGSYANGAFDASKGPDVSAVAFTMTGAPRRYDGVSSVDVIYLSPTGAELITQSVNASEFLTDTSNNYALLFAYAAPKGSSIGSVQINVNVKTAAERSQQVLFAIDDIGYTAAP